MLRKIFSGLLLFVLLAQGVFAATFSDVSNAHDHYVAVQYLAAKKIISGVSGTKFGPGENINRAAALKIIFLGNKLQTPTDTSKDSGFKDVGGKDWFYPYVVQAKALKIVSANESGIFDPARAVTKAEFVKMLLAANGFKPDAWADQNLFKDLPKGNWATPYMNYAGQAGLVEKDSANNVRPFDSLKRAEAAEILYLMTVIRNGKDSKFLVEQAQSQMAQVDSYMAQINRKAVKRSTDLAVVMSQQALKNTPNDAAILGVAKLARASDLLVNAFLSFNQGKYDDARSFANQSITKATEAWQADKNTQASAKHIKNRANEILGQIPKE